MRKHSPRHDFWHKIVEGQVRSVIGDHPEWFTLLDANEKNWLVNSLAKRIVGNIVGHEKIDARAVVSTGAGEPGIEPRSAAAAVSECKRRTGPISSQ